MKEKIRAHAKTMTTLNTQKASPTSSSSWRTTIRSDNPTHCARLAGNGLGQKGGKSNFGPLSGPAHARSLCCTRFCSSHEALKNGNTRRQKQLVQQARNVCDDDADSGEHESGRRPKTIETATWGKGICMHPLKKCTRDKRTQRHATSVH